MNDLDRIKMGIGFILCLLSIMALVQSHSAPYPFLRWIELLIAGIAMAYGVILTLKSAFKG